MLTHDTQLRFSIWLFDGRGEFEERKPLKPASSKPVFNLFCSLWYLPRSIRSDPLAAPQSVSWFQFLHYLSPKSIHNDVWKCFLSRSDGWLPSPPLCCNRGLPSFSILCLCFTVVRTSSVLLPGFSLPLSQSDREKSERGQTGGKWWRRMIATYSPHAAGELAQGRFCAAELSMQSSESGDVERRTSKAMFFSNSELERIFLTSNFFLTFF